MNYFDPVSGATYPADRARWCSDTGGYLNLAPGAGLKRGDIQTSRYSVWRYAKAIEVDDRHAVTMGEGWTPLLCGEWLSGQHRVPMMFKLEFMMPTGSLDRKSTRLNSSHG